MNIAVLPSYLNRRQSRGKWYVSLRGASFSIVKGFEGSRDELDAYLFANVDEIVDRVRKFDKRFLRSPVHWRTTVAASLCKSAAKRSLRKVRPFDLSPEWIEQRLEQIGDRCEVSGLPFVYSPAEKKWHKEPCGPSLDRIKPELGYVPSNVRIVCTSVNISINEWGEDLFFAMCTAVHKRREIGVQNG